MICSGQWLHIFSTTGKSQHVFSRNCQTQTSLLTSKFQKTDTLWLASIVSFEWQRALPLSFFLAQYRCLLHKATFRLEFKYSVRPVCTASGRAACVRGTYANSHRCIDFVCNRAAWTIQVWTHLKMAYIWLSNELRRRTRRLVYLSMSMLPTLFTKCQEKLWNPGCKIQPPGPGVSISAAKPSPVPQPRRDTLTCICDKKKKNN